MSPAVLVKVKIQNKIFDLSSDAAHLDSVMVALDYLAGAAEQLESEAMELRKGIRKK